MPPPAAHPGGGERVTLRHACGASAEIRVAGAHLLSWRLASGEEQLFVSSRSDLRPGSAVRGGVPVCWPRFGAVAAAADPPAAKHGFARGSTAWRVAALSGADGGPRPRAELRLSADDGLLRQWPHPFELCYTLELLPAAVRISLSARNTGDSPWEFTGALHTYFAVSNVAAAKVAGLHGARYMNCVGKKAVHYKADSVQPGDIALAGETDSIYGGAADVVELVDGPRRLRLTKHGLADWVVWNIGEEKAPGMKDLGPGEWRNYLCVEAAQASAALRVGVGESRTVAHTIEALHDPRAAANTIEAPRL